MRVFEETGRLIRRAYNALRPRDYQSVQVPYSYRVLAFLPVYNEADIIETTLSRLARSGVQAYVLDNWSTDGTWELVSKNASGNVLDAERNPLNGPGASYDLQSTAERIIALSQKIKPDWALWHDADEYFQPPQPSLSLRSALFRADQELFNAIPFRWITFPAVDNSFQPGADYVNHFQHWTAYYAAPECAWVRAWKGKARNLNIRGGSHEAKFSGRCLYPSPFVIRHYPIRSQQQGETKIFRERRPRYSAAGLARGWHVQYSHLAEGDSLLEDVRNLHRLEESTFLAEVRSHQSKSACQLCFRFEPSSARI